jgi:HSPB1-associated protein 1
MICSASSKKTIRRCTSREAYHASSVRSSRRGGLDSLTQQPKSWAMPQEIEYTASLSPEVLLKKYVQASRPVILTNVAAQWPAMQWTLSYFGSSFGHVRVHVRGSRVGMRDIGGVPLSEYIAWLLEGRLRAPDQRQDGSLLAPYHASHPVKPYVAYDANLAATSLREGFHLHSLLPQGHRFRTIRFWIGPEGAATPLHSDSWGFNLFFQVLGRKRFILYSPDQGSLLYPSDIFEFNTLYSRVNLLAPDHETFPRFRNARPIQVTLNPGEILVLPRCWWHDVEALDTSLSINAWVVTGADQLMASYLLNVAKKTLHGLGLYARGRCTCHLTPERPDVGQMLGWY